MSQAVEPIEPNEADPYLIFVTDATDGVCGEKIGHVEKFSPWHVVKWENSPHDKRWEKSVMVSKCKESSQRLILRSVCG